MRHVLICSAWPYANGSLHLGHIAGLLPADVLARYFRLRGDAVLFVSGSDCHGTPIAVRASQEGRSPRQVAEEYHREFVDSFAKLGFSYDRYAATMDEAHQQQVQDIIRRLHADGWLYPRTQEQIWCDHCQKFLPDRYVEGICPRCGAKEARGDQCDACGSLLDPEDLQERRCKLCGEPPTHRQTQHLFFKLSAFQQQIEQLLAENGPMWRLNAREMTRRYLREGLLDRAISRDIDWGVPIPLEGYQDKRVYVWFEAVLGYLTTSKRWAAEQGEPEAWRRFWSKDALSYYVHGKDNIPFHTVILPALLLAMGGDYNLPNRVISSEFLTIEGRKLSTSKNWAIWIPDFLENYQADSLRYFLIINGPEARDADFSWREFVERNNGELAGAWGNLVNRTIAFTDKYFQGRVPAGQNDRGRQLLADIEAAYVTVGNAIEEGRFKEALKLVFEQIRACNKYFDSEAPWQSIKTDREACAAAIAACLHAIANLAVLSSPFLPFAAAKVLQALGVEDPRWQLCSVAPGTPVGKPGILFPHLDREVIDRELAKLGQ
ncbi:MAG TPA: methionine--tRNA ligase [Bacillota bacterium]|nr:methionine--tRNA ligase [Bacillota bacterium]